MQLVAGNKLYVWTGLVLSRCAVVDCVTVCLCVLVLATRLPRFKRARHWCGKCSAVISSESFIRSRSLFHRSFSSRTSFCSSVSSADAPTTGKTLLVTQTAVQDVARSQTIVGDIPASLDFVSRFSSPAH